ncbi:MAG: hypothetical protein NTW95_14005, partial [Candidatus Aminicenantes bacterium]|nr:hypothetical protein [Candidatus Aminicenantes bacterium]
MASKRQNLSRLKCKFALLAAACFATLICGGSYAHGCQLSEDSDQFPAELHQPQAACAANFYLSPFRTNNDNPGEDSSESMTFSPQQQPFSEAPLLLW